jgi:hypothetical protein
MIPGFPPEEPQRSLLLPVRACRTPGCLNVVDRFADEVVLVAVVMLRRLSVSGLRGSQPLLCREKIPRPR